jgi:hypothetical protein
MKMISIIRSGQTKEQIRPDTNLDNRLKKNVKKSRENTGRCNDFIDLKVFVCGRHLN